MHEISPDTMSIIVQDSIWRYREDTKEPGKVALPLTLTDNNTYTSLGVQNLSFGLASQKRFFRVDANNFFRNCPLITVFFLYHSGFSL